MQRTRQYTRLTAYHNVHNLIWVLTIWDYYYQTGDLTLVNQQWPRIQQLLR